MERRYPPELIEECQKVIEKRAGFLISEDKAEIYLDAFARLGKLAIKVLSQKNNLTNDKSGASSAKKI